MIESLYTSSLVEKKNFFTVFGYLAILATSTFLLWYSKFLWNRRKLWAAANQLDGPKGLPLIGVGLAFLNTPTAIFQTLCSWFFQYGPNFSVWFGNRLFFIMGDPEDLEIAMTSQHCLEKDYLYKYTHPVVGTGLFSAPLTKWKRNRKIITPTFNSKILENFVEIFASKATVLIRVLDKYVGKSEDEFDIHQISANCTLETICQTAMGVQVNSLETNHEYGNWLDTVMRIIYLRMFVLIYQVDAIFQFTNIAKVFQESLTKLHQFTDNVITERKAQFEKQLEENANIPETGEDGVIRRKAFLDLLLDLKHNGNKFSDQDLRDEVLTFAVGGTDTSAITLSFSMAMMGMHPEIQEKIYREAIEVLGEDGKPTFDNLSELKYLERFIKETMRMFPPAPFIVRAVQGDVKMKSCVAPKGSSIMIPIIYTHRSPLYYKDPMKFDPDRFLPEEVAKRHPYTYLPFSAGPRGCIGQRYSFLALKSVLSTIVRHYKFDCGYKSIEDIKLKNYIVIRPIDGFKVTLQKRTKVH